ncbi:MAG: hypothetical protein CMK09_18690 [Ponticaulis sp.]|nr:hypothetical protein [Ponticaulis sp.]|tara:strand:+ start:110484 stop:112496 length:2013 start_codon:yes stop_codon:yes gene_type:complete
MRYQMMLVSSLAVLAACTNSGSSDNETPTQNTSPIITAGSDQTVMENMMVSLSSSLYDAEGDANISWTQVNGPNVMLDDPTSLTPSFRAPIVPEDLQLTFRVTASDGEFQSQDEMVITVNNVTQQGPSPQGIDDDSGNRRDRARNNRDDDRPSVEAREIRKFDGTKNNVDNALWGATFVHLQRWGTADYTDGISTMAGALRPSAREVSNAIVNQDEGESLPNTFGGTDFIWQWGQFIDHDIDLTDGAEETADIEVPTGDVWFDPDNLGTQIIPFSRALFDANTGTDASNPREQENEITSWIDGSMIYGSDKERADALRVSPDSAFLKTSAGNLLPFNEDDLTNANGFVTDPTTLFLAGDVRVNEQVGLAVMHTLFVREHNRIAQNILDNDPNKTGEQAYQDARRLVIGKIQKITYVDWLPALLGPDPLPGYSGYDDTLNATIYNEFSAAAYRLGHSMINDALWRLDASGAEITDGHLSLAEAFFTAPSILTEEESLDPILRGLAAQEHQALDPKIAHPLRNFLFGQPGLGGLDLASLNIQRGRDHGLPSYNDMREAMGLARVTAFSDITSDTDLAQALSDTYGSVDDIDLWVGGLSEDAFGDSQLGELFTLIIAKQFQLLRDGDRFWYEEDLRLDEVMQVKLSSLAQIIRDNTGVDSEIQDDVFHMPATP